MAADRAEPLNDPLISRLVKSIRYAVRIMAVARKVIVLDCLGHFRRRR